MKKRFLELPIHHKIFFVTVALSVLSASTFAGIFYAKKAFTSPAPSSPADFRMPTDPFQMKGETAGIGTHFAITDSEYLNITLDSFETIDIKLTSIPKVITMMFNRASSTSAAVTKITLAGFLPNTTYYKYEDDYHNLTEFTTDGDGNYSYNQDISVRHFVFIQTVKSTKFIADNATGGDCTTIGNWNQTTKTCTLAQDITETVQVDGDGITLDGNGHKISITPEYTTNGIYISGKTGVVLKNLAISGSFFSVFLNQSDNNNIRNNIFSGNYVGVSIMYGSNNTIAGNIISDINGYGLSVDYSNSNTVNDNTIDSSYYGIIFYGGSFGNRILNNTLNKNLERDINIGYDSAECDNTITGNTGSGGFPIGFFNSTTTLNGGTFSELILCNADHSDIRNVTIGDGSTQLNNNGFFVFYTDNATFTGITSNDNLYGIYLYKSVSNAFKNFTAIDFYSVYLVESNSNILNNISISGLGGIILAESDGNEFYGGTATAVMNLAQFSESNSNSIHNVTVSALGGSDCLSGYSSVNNLIYNNNFIDGTCNATGMIGNSFNLEKSIGGNYWSNYDTPAEGCSDADNDGFCDAPFVFDGGQDNLPWTRQDGWKGKTVKVAVILAETSDVRHASAPKTEQPCKLIPAKTYPNGHDKTYYDDMMFCVKDYYRENSYGTVNVEATVFPTWYRLRKTTADYVGKEEQFVQDAIVKAGVDVSGFDVVAAVHSGTAYQLTNNDPGYLITQAFSMLFPPEDVPPNKMVMAEIDPVGVWSHEIGHTLGEILLDSSDQTMVPDLYRMGLESQKNTKEGQWDLMANGVWNGGRNNQEGTDPSLMSSYTKEFLKLLSYNIKPKSVHGDFIIPALNQKPFGGSVFRYNLLENTADDNTTPYYILEARKKILPEQNWDTSIPKDALVAYYVNPLGYPEYGWGANTNTDGERYTNNMCRTINIPSGGAMSIGDTYNDYDNLVSFSAVSDSDLNGNYLIDSHIATINKDSILYKFKSFFLRPSDEFNKSECVFQGRWAPSPLPDIRLYHAAFVIKMSLVLLIVEGICFLLIMFCKYPIKRKKTLIILFTFTFILFFSIGLSISYLRNNGSRYGDRYYHWHEFLQSFFQTWSLPEFKQPPGPGGYALAPSLTPTTLPDLDLHAITSDGKHVGVNYATGEYENQIAGAIPSGDNQGSPEWILIPEETEARYYVSAHDNQTFLNENPDIASKMGSTEDSYEVYARYFDPATGIFTSATTSQTILPEGTDFYQIIGTTTPSVQSNNTDPISYLQGIRAYVTAMPFKNKGTKTAYLSQLANIEKSLAKKQTKPALSQIQALEKETNSHTKTNLIAKTDGEALLGMFAKLRELVKK
jgi:M6 family metalloprotease-like protein